MEAIYGRVRRIAPPLSGFTAGDIMIASEDGRELYQFDHTGRHRSTLNALTGAVLRSFTYDAGGLLVAITDGDGNATRVERSAEGIPVAVVAPFGQRTALSINAEGYLVSVADPAGNIVRLGYGAGGLLAQMTDPRGNTHRYAYDAAGRLVRDEDPAGGSKTLVRSEDGSSYTVSLSTALGRTNSYRIERLSAGGRRRVNTDAAGLKTVTTFGRDGSESTTAPDGTVLAVVPSADPRFGMHAPVLSSLTLKTPSGLSLNISTERSTSLSQPGNPLSLTQRTDKLIVNGRAFTSTYNAALRQFTDVTPEGRQAIRQTDALGRVIRSQVAGIEAVQYTYNAQGQIVRVAQGSRAWNYVYDPQGRLTSISDPLGRVEQYIFDSADRVERQVLPDGREIRYAYDANGNVTSITPPGRPAHVFDHTAVQLPDRYAPPLVGTDSTVTRYSYNRDRQLERITRSDGTTVALRYDAAGRLSTVAAPVGQFGYAYDSSTGKLVSVSAPGGSTLTHRYDGALPIGTSWLGEVSGSVDVRYNNDLQVSALAVNGENAISYNYDRDGLLTAAGALGISRNSYNGLLTGTTLGGITGRRSYNALGELSGDSVSIGSTPLFATDYARDGLGRITAITETIGGQTRTYGFLYDSVGRLREVRQDGAAVESYEYDANGNRTKLTSSNGVLTGSYDAQDRLLQYGNATYSYTANGELQTRVVGNDTTRYQYDAFGNLRMVTFPDGTQIEYLIDGQNRRIGKKVNGVRVQGLLYLGQLSPVAELDGNNQVVSRFIYGSKANVPDYMTRGGRTYRIVSDHLGSVRLVVDSSTGEIAQRIDYDAYGGITQNTNPGFQPFGYAGGLYDPATGLVRFGMRDYDARTGRWTATDPLGFNGGDSNLYSYVKNDPVNLIDPSGLCPCDELRNQIMQAIAVLQGRIDRYRIHSLTGQGDNFHHREIGAARRSLERGLRSYSQSKCDPSWNGLVSAEHAIQNSYDIPGPQIDDWKGDRMSIPSISPPTPEQVGNIIGAALTGAAIMLSLLVFG